MGGIHQFMRWPGPVLTDSGGYQIFSMPGERTITEEGARFTSYIDGRPHLLSPERSRVALLLAGWAVGAGDGIGTKSETTAAAVQVEDLARPVDRTWLRRLQRPQAPLPADAPADAVARAAAAPQFG